MANFTDPKTRAIVISAINFAAAIALWILTSGNWRAMLLPLSLGIVFLFLALTRKGTERPTSGENQVLGTNGEKSVSNEVEVRALIVGLIALAFSAGFLWWGLSGEGLDRVIRIVIASGATFVCYAALGGWWIARRAGRPRR